VIFTIFLLFLLDDLEEIRGIAAFDQLVGVVFMIESDYRLP
jgi:hypothetical protein